MRTENELAIQMAHDIRSPLSALLAVMTLPGYMDDRKKTLALKATLRLQEIAEDIMTNYRCAQQNAHESQIAIEVASVVESIIEEKKLTLPRDITIQTDFTGCVVKTISKHRARELKRILSNMMNNAVEAIYKKSEGGTIKISMNAVVENVEITLEDNGCGMEKEILKQIGRQGFTWNKKVGHGLALHRAKKVISQWGGTLKFDSEKGLGTKVRMMF